jgi:hypothetical protein
VVKNRAYNEYRRKLRASLKLRGICTGCMCRPVIPSKTKCVKCAARMSNWQKCSLHKISRNGRKYYRKTRLAALEAYGNKCSCNGCSWHKGKCNIDNISVLTIDHINGGHRHNLKIKKEYLPLARWLKMNNYPPGFRVLCANCHLCKSIANVPRRHQDADSVRL